MFPRPTRRSLARAAASLALATALSGCGPNPGSGGSPSSPPASGAAACQTAPAPPDDLAGWTKAAPSDIQAVVINPAGQIVCGENRILFTIEQKDGAPVGAPDRTGSIAFFDLGRDPAKPIVSAEGTFVWAIKYTVGIYVANVSFSEAGQYGAEITTAKAGGAPEKLRVRFNVQPSTTVIGVGDKAPASKTPTLSDVGGDASHISTDTQPDPAFYKTSIDQAVAKHEPFVVVFATPAFCVSRTCGPTLDSVKPYVAKYPSVTFIHVEPYKLKLVGGALQADTDKNGGLHPTVVTNDEWHLVTEPVVYVVNRDGVVTAQFDLIFSDTELIAALDAVK
jgi:hypothetical protein